MANSTKKQMKYVHTGHIKIIASNVLTYGRYSDII